MFRSSRRAAEIIGSSGVMKAVTGLLCIQKRGFWKSGQQGGCESWTMEEEEEEEEERREERGEEARWGLLAMGSYHRRAGGRCRALSFIYNGSVSRCLTAWVSMRSVARKEGHV